MNAEPPTARFQVEHQPRRPGYAKRYRPTQNAGPLNENRRRIDGRCFTRRS